MRRTILSPLFVIAVLAARPAAAVPVPGDPEDLIAPPNTGVAHAINAGGTVAGTLNEGGRKSRAFRATGGDHSARALTPPGGFPTAFGLGINAGGTVVGVAESPNSQSPEVFRAYRGSTLLPSLGQNNETAFSINDSGVVVGGAAPNTAVAWVGTQIKVLSDNSAALSINNSGKIVGAAGGRAVVWDSPDDTSADLLPLPPGAISSIARDINDQGQIVGTARFSDGVPHAILWEGGAGGTATDLGPAAEQAVSINNQGEVVGLALAGFPFIWDAAHGMRNLNDFLPPCSEWHLGRAEDINDSRIVVGVGSHDPDGRGTAYRFHVPPVPPMGACGGQGEAIVSGKVTYEKVKQDNTGRLKLNQKTKPPAPGVRVEVVSATSGATLGHAFTAEGGDYTVHVPLDAEDQVFVRVLAQMLNMGETDETHPTQVVDDQSGALYSVRSPATGGFRLRPNDGVTRNVLAKDSNRASGPFNILAAIRKGQQLIKQAEPVLHLSDALTVKWSTTLDRGSHFGGDSSGGASISLDGERSDNSDEFDDSVILHEYGHFVAGFYSEDDSLGGQHALTDALDPRDAWSEGWATFFGQATLGRPTYLDSFGPNGSQGFRFNIDIPDPSLLTLGYTGELAVSSCLWDIFDETQDEGDSLALGFPSIWRAFRDLINNSFVYLIDFADALVSQDPSTGAGVTENLALREAEYRPGQAPSIINPFPALLPEPTLAPHSQPGFVDSFSVSAANRRVSRDLYQFDLSATETVDIRLAIEGPNNPSAPSDLDLFLISENGRTLLGASQTAGGAGSEERITMELPAGTYVIEVSSVQGRDAFDFIFNQSNYTLTTQLQ